MRSSLRCHAVALTKKLGLLIIAPALFASSPPAGHAGAATTSEPSAVANPVTPDQGRVPSERLRLRSLPDSAASGRGHSFTDAGYGLTVAPPTGLERVKLELARAAVEASRRAGTLQAPAREEPRIAVTFIDAAHKLDRLRARRPAILRPDAAAGLSPEHRPIQLSGPAVLNPIEKAKRDGMPLPAPAPTAPAPVDRTPAGGDGAPTPPRPASPEGPRHE